MSTSLADAAPLILTLRLDAGHQARFDALRSGHFPRERNVLAAHVTLFHKLPAAEAVGISDLLSNLADETPGPEVSVEQPFLLGGGVAFRLVSPEADTLRRRLADEWRDQLTPQDRNASRLHVTVQNKVAAREARALHAALAAGFSPSRFTSPGLDLWRYRGGPWDHAASFDFSA